MRGGEVVRWCIFTTSPPFFISFYFFQEISGSADQY